ncbi:hypothetical protein HDU67_008244 [Dinochytrium kinnereticum]|nr:hypothetical protein HDU67_008244 [Dinochytrium kinnereticum]
MAESKVVSFLAKTSLSYQVWKETQPDLHWFLERNFQALSVDLRQTGDDKSMVVEMEVSSDHLGKLEKAFKDGSLAVEMDKIHGIDFAIHGKKDVGVALQTLKVLSPVMDNLLSFQLEIQKRMDGLEKKFDETCGKVDAKCDKLEKSLARYRK